MKSIFYLENRLDVNREFERLVEIFHFDTDAALFAEDEYHQKQYSTVVDAIDKKVFLKWKYRDTFIDVNDYLEHLGIKSENVLLFGADRISKTSFLYYLEFFANMFLLIKEDGSIELSNKAIAAIENIPKILEKMNYKLKKLDDKVIIVKRNSDVDSVLSMVPENIVDILLEYNDFRIKDNIEEKKKILKNVDLYIEKNVNVKSFDRELDSSIGMIVNKMGVNHPIKEEPFKSYTKEQLIEWYDKCFLMMIHAIRTVEVNRIKQERKELLNNN